jgi:ArsR family transcriptional regulator
MLYAASTLDVSPLSRAFSALGDETRLKIVALLTYGEMCVCHVESALGLSQPTASRHLGVLHAAGVVDKRRVGTWVHYRISQAARNDVKKLLALLKDTFSHERNLREGHAHIRKSCGPEA